MNRWPTGFFLTLIATAAVLAGIGTAGKAQEAGAPAPGPHVLHLDLQGAIGPATASYVVRGLEEAAERGSAAVVLQMDTPGGLDTAMRDIIKAIIASPVPVITYVAPGGARAASAGTYILYASHVAAMAPATNLGAATPVQVGGGDTPATPAPAGEGTPGEGEDEEGEEPAPAGEPGTAMERKAVNDAVAYIRGLAELRGRNAEWAELAVRTAASLNAAEALEEKVIDLVAGDVADLLRQADGRTVATAGGDRKLEVAELVVERYEADWRIRFLATITDPNVAYLLMLVGIYGLLFEGYSPGALVPGVVGAICLLLALFAFQVLSVNYAGLALIGLGVALIIAEVFAPSFGVLGLGGIVAFVFGSILLMDESVPGMAISNALIGGVALTASAGLLTMMLMLMRARRRPVVSGPEGMIGQRGEALEDFTGRGPVFVHGERWNARCPVPLRRGDPVRVLAIDGLLLEVEPVARDDAGGSA